MTAPLRGSRWMLVLGAAWVVVTAAGCSADAGDAYDGEDAEEVDASEEALESCQGETETAAAAALKRGTIRVLDMNFNSAGRYDVATNHAGNSGPVTWGAFDLFMKKLDRCLPGTAVIGMQDIGSVDAALFPTIEAFETTLADRMNKATGHARGTWKAVVFIKTTSKPVAEYCKVDGIPTGILYRSDWLTERPSARTMFEIESTNRPCLSTTEAEYKVRLGATAFSLKSNPAKKFLLTTGKLVWGPNWGQIARLPKNLASLPEEDRAAACKRAAVPCPARTTNGVWKLLDPEEQRKEAIRLRSAVAAHMTKIGFTRETSIITIDMNNRYRDTALAADDGGNAWKELTRAYESGWKDEDLRNAHTDHGRAFDQVFWSKGASGTRPVALSNPGADHKWAFSSKVTLL